MRRAARRAAIALALGVLCGCAGGRGRVAQGDVAAQDRSVGQASQSGVVDAGSDANETPDADAGSPREWRVFGPIENSELCEWCAHRVTSLQSHSFTVDIAQQELGRWRVVAAVTPNYYGLRNEPVPHLISLAGTKFHAAVLWDSTLYAEVEWPGRLEHTYLQIVNLEEETDKRVPVLDGAFFGSKRWYVYAKGFQDGWYMTWSINDEIVLAWLGEKGPVTWTIAGPQQFWQVEGPPPPRPVRSKVRTQVWKRVGNFLPRPDGEAIYLLVTEGARAFNRDSRIGVEWGPIALVEVAVAGKRLGHPALQQAMRPVVRVQTVFGAERKECLAGPLDMAWKDPNGIVVRSGPCEATPSLDAFTDTWKLPAKVLVSK
jgi:hypothetical protein